jgi:hypothetical protein
MADNALPDYPASTPASGALADASAPATQMPMANPMSRNPPQGTYGGAGGRDEHHLPDGGIGIGAQAPPGWPRYHQPD